jgi:hypothetical protein
MLSMQDEQGLTAIADLSIAGAVCLIALAALVLAVWEANQQRRHNRLSVAPKLRINCVTDSNSRLFGLVLSNCGFGPALVKSFEVTIDGSPLPTPRLHTLASVLSIEDLLSWAFPNEDDVVKPGEDLPLFGTYAKRGVDLGRMKVALKRIGIRVRYESLYGESHTVSIAGSELRSLSSVPLPDSKADGAHNTAAPADQKASLPGR